MDRPGSTSASITVESIDKTRRRFQSDHVLPSGRSLDSAGSTDDIALAVDPPVTSCKLSEFATD